MPVEAIFCLACDYPLGELQSHRCPECGLEFDLNDRSTFRRALVKPTTVYSARDQGKVYLIRHLVEAAGIPAIVISNNSGLVGLETVDLQVGKANYQEAKAVIQQFESEQLQRRNDGPGTMWKCPDCGEDVEPTFEICWNCQTERPEGLD